jgi:DNA-binding NtrC family response regulator
MEAGMSDNPSVLILDDEVIVCQRLQEHLEKKSMEVETFTDSQSAIDRLAEKRFDVVVTDLKMKGPSGLDVLQFVRGNSPSTEVIIITGYASMEAAREAEYTGVAGFITKPFQMESVSNLIKKAAKQARKQGGRSEP